jgi:hypothetical protein
MRDNGVRLSGLTLLENGEAWCCSAVGEAPVHAGGLQFAATTLEF